MGDIQRFVLEFILVLCVFALLSVLPPASNAEPVSTLPNDSAMIGSTAPTNTYAGVRRVVWSSPNRGG